MSHPYMSADEHIRAALEKSLEDEMIRVAAFDREMLHLRKRIAALQAALATTSDDVESIVEPEHNVSLPEIPSHFLAPMLPRRAKYEVPTDLLRRLKGLSQPAALIEIARYHGGILKTADAKKILLDAKLITGNPKNALSHMYALLREPERFQSFGSRLEKIGPGEFRLVPWQAETEIDRVDNDEQERQSVDLA